jgi:hypothetical protein
MKMIAPVIDMQDVTTGTPAARSDRGLRRSAAAQLAFLQSGEDCETLSQRMNRAGGQLRLPQRAN